MVCPKEDPSLSAFGLPPRLDVVAPLSDVVGGVATALIGNALKFTPKGGRVNVGVERAGGAGLRISVTDTGQGMTREELSHAFDRFWQARASSRGTAGLGLAICRGIVGAHGGEIVVASEPGAGSTFSFTLPVAEAPCDRDDALRCAPPPDVKVA